jgi:polyphenol oxidase
MNLISLAGLPVVQFPLLQQYKAIRHGVTTRQGGVSSGPFQSLNLGYHTGDRPAQVLQNRNRVFAAFGWKDEEVVTPVQVHGNKIVTVSDHSAREGISAQASPVLEADGLITNVKGVGLMIKVADCVPVFFYDPAQRAIGLVHAGWRGTAAGIISAAIDALRETYGTKPEQLIAGIGPGIGSCCYEVGNEVCDAFGDRDSGSFLSPAPGSGAPHLDLKRAIFFDLLRCGVNPDTVDVADACTFCREDLFFSHRRDQGKTGRMGALIGLVD